ncbi:MAG: FAD-dependent oxidoreductase, partial [Acidobacteriota bacterium]
MSERPHIVIIGGGFGGLLTARGLAKADARVTLIDRRNHHLFQPLLYQVATGGLSPANIAAPLRALVKKQKNTSVLLHEVTGLDLDARTVEMDDHHVNYDYLVVATGAGQSYFGNDQWAERAPGLKSIEDATEIRRRVLSAFELAEQEDDPDLRRELLTFVVVGAGA